MSELSSLHAVTRRWADAFNAADLPTLMTVYDDDAVVVPGPGAEPVVGLAAIEVAMAGFLALEGQISYTTRYWVINGDTALGSNAFVIAGGHDETGSPVELRGVTIEVVRRRRDGSWRYVIDHPFGGADVPSPLPA